MIYVSNALPGALVLRASVHGLVSVRPISQEQASSLLLGNEFVSAVGHADTAALFSNLLGREISFNRVSLPADLLEGGKAVLLCGLMDGPRLLEGSSTLPEGATIAWCLVSAPITGVVEEGPADLSRPLPGEFPGCYNSGNWEGAYS